MNAPRSFPASLLSRSGPVFCRERIWHPHSPPFNFLFPLPSLPVTPLLRQIDEVCTAVALKAETAAAELGAMAAEDPAGEDAVIVNVYPHSDTVQVTYSTDSITIHRDALTRLNKLYVIHGAAGDPDLLHLNSAVYCVLRRYLTLTDQTLGASFESAAPRALLRLLNDDWDVCFEVFASPLNSFFRNFTSPFPDTDSVFGSMGSFFQFVPQQGSFFVHPARVQEVLDRAAEHVCHILSEQQGPLSFVFLAPDWEDPPPAGLVLLDQSPYLRASFKAEEGSHTLVSGLEHIADGAWDTWRVVPHLGTRVYILQNEAGANVWHTSRARIDALRACMGAPSLADEEDAARAKARAQARVQAKAAAEAADGSKKEGSVEAPEAEEIEEAEEAPEATPGVDDTAATDATEGEATEGAILESEETDAATGPDAEADEEALLLGD